LKREFKETYLYKQAKGNTWAGLIINTSTRNSAIVRNRTQWSFLYFSTIDCDIWTVQVVPPSLDAIAGSVGIANQADGKSITPGTPPHLWRNNSVRLLSFQDPSGRIASDLLSPAIDSIAGLFGFAC